MQCKDKPGFCAVMESPWLHGPSYKIVLKIALVYCVEFLTQKYLVLKYMLLGCASYDRNVEFEDTL